MSGAIHEIGSLTAQWVFANKIKICYPDRQPLWTTSFVIVWEEFEKHKKNAIDGWDECTNCGDKKQKWISEYDSFLEVDIKKLRCLSCGGETFYKSSKV